MGSPYHRHYYEKYGGSHRRRSHLDDIYLPNYEDDDIEDTSTSSSRSKFHTRYSWIRNNVPSRSNYRYPLHRTINFIKRPQKSPIKSSSDETSLEDVTKVLGDSTSGSSVEDKSSTSDNKCDSVQSDSKTDVPNQESDSSDRQCLKTDSNSVSEENVQFILSEGGEQNKEDSSSEVVSSQEQTIFMNMDSDEELKGFDFNNFITVDNIDTGKSYLRRTPIVLDNFEVIDMDISPMKRKSDSDENINESKKIKYEKACFEINSNRLLNEINEVFKENKQASERATNSNRFRSKSVSSADTAREAKSMAKSLSIDAIDRSTYQITYNFDIKTNLLLLLKDHKSNSNSEISSNGLNSILQFLVNTKNERNNTEDVSVVEGTANQNDDFVECCTNQHNEESVCKVPVTEEIAERANKRRSKDCENNEETEDEVETTKAKDLIKSELEVQTQFSNNCNGNNEPISILGTVKNELVAVGANLKRKNSTDNELTTKKRLLNSTEEYAQSVESCTKDKDLIENNNNDKTMDLVHAQDIKKEKEISPLETADTKCNMNTANVIQNADLVAKNDITDEQPSSSKTLGEIEEELKCLLEGTDDEFTEEQQLPDLRSSDKNDAQANFTSNDTSDILKILNSESIVTVLIEKDLKNPKEIDKKKCTEKETDTTVMSSQSAINCDTDIKKSNIKYSQSCSIDVEQFQGLIDFKKLSVNIVKEQFTEKTKPQDKENKNSRATFRNERGLERHQKGNEKQRKNEEKTLADYEYCKRFKRMKSLFGSDSDSEVEEDKLNAHRKNNKHSNHNRKLEKKVAQSTEQQSKPNVCNDKKTVSIKAIEKRRYSIPASDDKHTKKPLVKDAKMDKSGPDLHSAHKPKHIERRRETLPASLPSGSTKDNRPSKEENRRVKDKPRNTENNENRKSVCIFDDKQEDPRKEYYRNKDSKKRKQKEIDMISCKSKDSQKCKSHRSGKQDTTKKTISKVHSHGTRDKKSEHKEKNYTHKNSSQQRNHSSQSPLVDQTAVTEQTKSVTTDSNEQKALNIAAEIKLKMKNAVDEKEELKFEHCVILLNERFPVPQRPTWCVQENDCSERAVVLESVDISRKIDTAKQVTSTNQEEDIIEVKPVIPIIDLTEDTIDVKTEEPKETKPTDIKPCIDSKKSLNAEETITLYRSEETVSNSLDVQATSESILPSRFLSKEIDVVKEITVISSSIAKNCNTVLTNAPPTYKNPPPYVSPVPNTANISNVLSNLSVTGEVTENTRFAMPSMQTLKPSGLVNNRQNIVPKPNQTSAQTNRVQQVQQNSGPQNVLLSNQIRQEASTVQHNSSPQNLFLTNQIRQEDFIIQQNSSSQNVLLTNQFRQEALTVQHNSSPQSISLTNNIRQEALIMQQNSSPQNVLLANQIRQEALNVQQNGSPQNVLLANQIRQNTLPVQQNSSSQNVLLTSQIRQEALIVQQNSSHQNFSSVSSIRQEGLITSRAVQQTCRSNVHQVANGGSNPLRQIRLASNKLRNLLVRDNRQNTVSSQNVAPQNIQNPSSSLSNVSTRNNGNFHSPMKHADDRPSPMQEICVGDFRTLCIILSRYLYFFNGLKKAQSAYTNELHNMQRFMPWFVKMEVHRFENYATDRYKALSEELARELTSLNLIEKPVIVTQLLADHLFKELRKKMPDLTISWFYLMVESLLRPQMQKYQTVQFLRNLYGFVAYVVKNLKDTQTNATRQISKDLFTPDQLKYLEWQIQQYKSINVTQRRLVAEKQYNVPNSNLNNTGMTEPNKNNSNIHNEASNNFDNQSNCNFTAHQNIIRQLQTTIPNHVEVSIPNNHTSDVNNAIVPPVFNDTHLINLPHTKPASVSQQQEPALSSQCLDMQSPELSSSSTSQMASLQGTTNESQSKSEVVNDPGETTVKDEKQNLLLTDQEIETIDLTWINDIDPHQLEEEMEHIAIKKEFVKKEEEEGEVVLNDELFAVAPSPADSGISSPPIQVEYDETLFSDRSCICGKVAEYVCKCMLVMYCSGTCQMEDWSSHRDVCNKQKRSQQGRAT